ncbi:hypothetical protein NW754_004343 [Fusarium falciforme]|nr:hypothetical protein NW754_004343 [Fusarium falciforme]
MMADPKSKNVNGNHANGNHVSDKTSTKQSKLRQLLILAKEVSKDAEAIQDYEKSVEERKALEQELEAKQGENQRLRELNDKVMRDLTDQKNQASAASAASETLVATFEQKFKTYESNKAAVGGYGGRGRRGEGRKLAAVGRGAEGEGWGVGEVEAEGQDF